MPLRMDQEWTGHATACVRPLAYALNDRPTDGFHATSPGLSTPLTPPYSHSASCRTILRPKSPNSGRIRVAQGWPPRRPGRADQESAPSPHVVRPLFYSYTSHNENPPACPRPTSLRPKGLPAARHPPAVFPLLLQRLAARQARPRPLQPLPPHRLQANLASRSPRRHMPTYPSRRPRPHPPPLPHPPSAPGAGKRSTMT